MTQNLITIILLAISLVSLLGVFMIAIWMFRNSPSSKKQGRISNFVAPSSPVSQAIPALDPKQLRKENIGKLRDWINSTLSGLSSEKLKLKISSAYWPITDTEYILIRIGGTVLTFLLGWWLPGNFLGGVFLAALAIMIPPIILDRSIAQRQQKFHNQLLDVLILIKGAVQAGYSLMQALDLAVKETPAPASDEFGRVIREVRFGLTLETALINLGNRMASDDLQIVVTAIIINSQVGGNLSTVLESTISTIRDRMQLFGEIRSLTSYARYVGNFLTLMPFIMGILVFILSPDYFSAVRTSALTQIVFLMALVGIIIGNIWIRRIVRVKV
jgi:tight adherence protein B